MKFQRFEVPYLEDGKVAELREWCQEKVEYFSTTRMTSQDLQIGMEILAEDLLNLELKLHALN